MPCVCLTEMEFDLDKALEEVPIHVEDPPPPSSQPLDRMSACYGDLLPPPPPPPLDTKPVCLSELPPVEHKTLEHHTKLRPKPKKRTKPSRPAVGSHQLSVNHQFTYMCHLFIRIHQNKFLLQNSEIIRRYRRSRITVISLSVDKYQYKW